MVYCQRCGKKNEDAAQFCNQCGSSLHGPSGPSRRKPEDQCEEECGGSKQGNAVFWGIIILLVGLWIIFEFGLKRIEGMPDWIYSLEIWWLIPLVIGLAIILAGIKMITKKNRNQ
jgi:uncharacterized membrane protein YvbJ